MGRKKKMKCAICMQHEHQTHECPCIYAPCSKERGCKYFCMFDLCKNFHKTIKNVHKASSSSKIERALEKLDAFEGELEDALEYLDDHKCRKIKSCSSKKGIRMLRKSCVHLREKFEDKFESDESSDDDEEEWSYPMGVSVIEKKGIAEGVNQGSHQNPIQTQKPTSGLNPNEVDLQFHNLKDMCDPCNACVDHENDSEKQISELSPVNKNQVEVQSGIFGYSDFQKLFLFGSFASFAMQGERSKSNEDEFADFQLIFSQNEDQASVPECKTEYSHVQELHSEFFEGQVEQQKAEYDSENAQNEEEFNNLLIFHSNSDFYDALVADQEQINLFLSNVCEEVPDTLIHSPELIQMKCEANQIEDFLNLKNQEHRLLEPKSGYEVMNSHLQVLQMLKKQSLMIAKVFSSIEPFLCHFQVKSDLFERLIATNWWLKIILEMFLVCMSMFSKHEVAEVVTVSNFGVYQDQGSMLEVHIADFLNTEVANQILKMKDVEFDDSMIYVSYCLNQILQIDNHKKRVLSLILQNPYGFEKDVMFWMFFMLNLQSLMSRMIQSSKMSCFDSKLPKMLDFEEDMLMDQLDHIFVDCWKQFSYLKRCFEAEYADLQIQGSLKIQEDIQVLMPELQKSDFQSHSLMLQRMQRLGFLMFIPYSWSVDIIIDLWFHKFILYDVRWMLIYMKGSQPWHVAIKWSTCIHIFKWDAQRECTYNAFKFFTYLDYGEKWFLIWLYVPYVGLSSSHFGLQSSKFPLCAHNLMDKAFDLIS